MKKWSKAFALIIVIIFVQAITSCGYFAPEGGEEPESTTTAPIIAGENQDAATAEATATDSLPPTPTAEPSPTPLAAAAILTNTSDGADPAPRLIGRNPAGADTLGLGEPIELYFDQPMEPTSTSGAFTFVDADGAAISGQIDWPQPRVLRFTPETVLTTGSQYNVILADTATAASGMTLLEAISLNLFTIGDLEVSSVSPAANATNVASDSAITVIFSRPVVPLVNAEVQDTLPSPITIFPETPGTGEWINTSVYIWRPSIPLVGRATYDVTVSADIVNEVSASGAQLPADFSWSFGVTAPTLSNLTLPGLSRWVSDRYDDFPPDRQPFLVTFNQPMDEAATQSAITLIQGDTQASTPLEFSWNEIKTAVTITPTQDLELASSYFFTVDDSALSAAKGQLRQGRTLQVNTVGFPGIERTNPSNNGTQTEYSSGFDIFFDTEMDPDSLDGKVLIDPPITGDPNGQYNRWRRSISFWGLSPATTYNVTILPGMADPYGNVLNETINLSFTTPDRRPFVSLEMNYPFALYRYNGSSDAWVRHVNAADFQFNVYEFNEFSDFFKLVNDYNINSHNPEDDNFLQFETGSGEPGSNITKYERFELKDPNGNMHPPGFYYLTLNSSSIPKRGQRHNDARPIIIANGNLTLKTTANEAFAWLTSLDTGAPISGQEVILYNEDFEVVSQATTDADGIANMNGLELETGWGATYYAIVNSDSTTAAAITNWNEGVSPWDFGIRADYYSSNNNLRGYIYTDRPLYRPDQTVFIKGIIRQDNDLNYAIPVDIEDLWLEIYSFEGELLRQQVTPNSMGSFELEIELDSEAVLGDYSIQISQGKGNNREWVGSGTFAVAEYRKPTFQVTVEESAANVVDGDTLLANIKAEFFSGGGVSNSTLTWNLTAQNTTFQPSDPNLSRYSFNTAERDRRFYFDPYDDYNRGSLIADGKGTTNGSGEYALDLPAELESTVGTRRMTLEAVVTDLAGNVVAGRTTYTIHPGSQYAGIKSAQYIGIVDEPMGLELIVIDLDSQIIPGATVDVEVVKRNWFSVQEDDGNGNLVWTSTVEEVPVAEVSGVTMDENGRGLAEFIPTEGGTYRAYARTTDANGKEITTSTFFWVSGNDYVPWRRINDHSFELIPDGDKYSPGDTAKLLIASPFQGLSYALITVERGAIYESEVIPLTSNSTIYELPITAKMAPNVYVSVIVMKGIDEFSDHPDFKVGYAQFTVDREQQELNIEIVPDQTKLGPRDTVTYDITVTDANGAPVEAELSLALVDLAVLSLKKEAIPTLLDYFYSERSLSVATALLLTKEMDSFNAEVEDEAKGGGGGFGAEGITSVREIFKDTAFWSAVINTDANGKAKAEVTLPDNLTTWRLDARAITADTKVGQATNDIVSTRPLLVSPQTPRFFVIGDQLTIGTVVRNTTDSPISANVSVSAVGLDLANGAAQTVEIAAEGQAFVSWQATVQDTDRVDLIFQAEGGGFSDASRPTLGTLDNQGIPVYKYEVFETVGTSGQMLEGGVIVESIGLPVYDENDYIPTQGNVTIELAPSLAAAMTTGLDYLEHYEYECTEQVVSRFLPNVLTTKAMIEAGVSDPELKANLDAQVNVALQKIYARQRPNGGWSWWDNPRSETNTLVASYVILSLIEAQDAGYNVRPEVITNGLNYLRQKVDRADGLNARPKFNRQAFVVYVMTQGGQPDPNLVEELFEQRENMDLYARAYLARALHLVDPEDPRLVTLTADFTSAAVFSATGTHWEESGGNDYWNWNTDTRTTAIVMGTMAQLDSENPLVANSVRWLMNHRTNGRWGGTQTTAWAIMALTDWMIESGELNANYDFEVALNGELIGQGSGAPETLRDTTEIVRDITELSQDELNRLAIGRTAGEGNLYYTAYMKVGLPVEEIQARDDGIVISRSYFNPDDPTQPITEAVVGDTVMVRLSIVAPRYLHYVGIADWLPAGLEPIDTSLETSVQSDLINTEQGGQRTDFEPNYYNYYSRGFGWWYFQHAQLRDEKVELSARYLPKGTYEYVYLARAATPGTFNVIPPQAEQFYHPEVSGRGAGMQFVVHPVGTTLTTQQDSAEPIRIQFAPGTVSGEVDGYVGSGEKIVYSLGAGAGQTMTVEVISPNSDVAFAIISPDNSGIGSVTTDSPTWTGELPAEGDYTITLTTPGAGTGYLLRVTIE
ncbi:MAG: Ig-like domain-containing protein [Anaerolineae bacterium]